MNNPIVECEFYKFLSFPNEKILVSKRQHFFTLLPSFLLTLGAFIVVLTAFFFFFTLFLHSFSLFLISLLFLSILAISNVAKTFIDWYFHVYIVTSKKILKVRYSPFTSINIVSIILDQVKCTEIDTQTNGFLKSVLNIGNITITFDRPTHQEALVFYDIENYLKVGDFLRNFLDTSKFKQKTTEVWYKSKKNPKKFEYRTGGEEEEKEL